MNEPKARQEAPSFTTADVALFQIGKRRAKADRAAAFGAPSLIDLAHAANTLEKRAALNRAIEKCDGVSAKVLRKIDYILGSKASAMAPE